MTVYDCCVHGVCDCVWYMVVWLCNCIVCTVYVTMVCVKLYGCVEYMCLCDYRVFVTVRVTVEWMCDSVVCDCVEYKVCGT